ncbi:MAG: hypothetical protein ACOC1P_06550 [Minisyncoccales bacterium]
MPEYKTDGYIVVAVPSITNQNEIICVGNRADIVSQLARDKGYKNSVIFQVSWDNYLKMRNFQKEDNKKKTIENRCSNILSIPNHVLEKSLYKDVSD